MTRLTAIWESIRATYWAVPSTMAVAAIALAFGIVRVDESLTAEVVDAMGWVYTGGAEGARAVLSTIAASMITVAGVTFSITIVALTLASQQFGPRLLRNFLRDLGNQIVLGTFVSTFIYCLLVLRTVRGSDGDAFVPHLAVTIGVALAVASLGVLIFFIHHVSTSIHATQVIANVSADLEAGIRKMFPQSLGEGAPAGADDGVGRMPPGFDDEARSVMASSTGYVQGVDTRRLMTLAGRHALVARVEARPGAFVRQDAPLLRVWLARSRDREADDDLVRALREAFIIGADRTGTQDLSFFLTQLVDLAVRALSPGVNDPATARTCLDRIEQALCHLAGRHIPSAYRCDEHGALRVVAQAVTFVEMADLAFEEIGRHSASSVSVTCRLLDAIGAISGCVRREEDRRALARHATVVARRSLEALVNDADQAEVRRCHQAAIDATGRGDQ